MTTPINDSTQGRNLSIDMLRGVSILLVMLLHFTLSYRLHASPLNAWVPVPVLRTIFYNGNYGVSIFFAISGFLITSNIIARYGSLVQTDVRHFYALRFFRLYQSMVLALTVITILGLCGLSNFANTHTGTALGNGFFLIADLSVLTFWHNVLMGSVGYFNYAMNIYWSLSVEEVFYLVYPLVLVLARRRWMLIVLGCAALVVAPLYRWVHSDDELFYLYGNLACVDMLVFGCAAAVAARQFTLGRMGRRGMAWLAVVAMGWVYMRGIGGNEAFGPTLLGVAVAVFLVAVSRLEPTPFARRVGKPLAWLGAHSYELYLFHIVVLGVMVEIVPKGTLAAEYKLPMLALFFVLSIAVAWTVARYYGDPLNRRLRRRFVRRPLRNHDGDIATPDGHVASAVGRDDA